MLLVGNRRLSLSTSCDAPFAGDIKLDFSVSGKLVCPLDGRRDSRRA